MDHDGLSDEQIDELRDLASLLMDGGDGQLSSRDDSNLVVSSTDGET